MFRNLPEKVDLKKPVRERGRLDMDVIGQLEAPRKFAPRNTLIKETAVLLGFANRGPAFDAQNLAFDGQSDVVFLEPGQGEILRIENMLKSKDKSRQTAESVFKS